MASGNRQERREIAASYGMAVYELAHDAGKTQQMRDELTELMAVLDRSDGLEQVLDSPIVSVEDRQRLVDQLADGCDAIIAGLLTVMNRRSRLGLLRETMVAFCQEHDRRQGKIAVTVTTAGPIDQALTDDIRERLGRFLRRQAILKHKIDPGILGGFVAHAGDLLIDGSVRTQLAGLKDQLLVRGEDEIQSGRDYVGNKA